MFDIIFNSIFDHMFDIYLLENPRFLVIAPTFERVRKVSEMVVEKLKNCGLDYKIYHSNPIRIIIEDITIEFAGSNSQVTRGYDPDYLFLFDSKEYSEEANCSINALRGTAVVIG